MTLLCLSGCQQLPPELSKDISHFFDSVKQAVKQPPADEASIPEKGEVGLEPIRYETIAGWTEGQQHEALKTFLVSCQSLLKRPDNAPVLPEDIGGHVGAWKEACQMALEMERPTRQAAQLFFEEYFTPMRLIGENGREGLFTGYYELALKGSLTKRPGYLYPVYGTPKDMVKVPLASFDPRLEGETLVGQLQDNTLMPYPDRQTIETKGLSGKASPIAWVKDPVELFFLHIQGSGVLELPDGKRRRIGYAAKNGRPYVALGKLMVERGLLSKDNVSAQSIKQWLRDNPVQARSLMRENPSYVFFQIGGKEGPVGAQGVPLTPERSLAVDRQYIPLGAPIWLDTTTPALDQKPAQSYRRLMIAQDTGSAIQGPVRGDIFWGAGARAEAMAGHMQSKGQAILLLPRRVAESLMGTDESPAP
jgi:membrane-bound lytic murein transglycosylase A